MIRWIVYLTTGFLLVAAVLVSTFSPPTRAVSDSFDPARLLVGVTNSLRHQQAGELQFARVADSLARRLARARPEGGLLVESAPGTALDGAEAIRDRGLRLLEERDRVASGGEAGFTGPMPRVGLFVVPMATARPEGTSTFISDPAFVAGVDGDRPWCLRIQGASARETRYSMPGARADRFDPHRTLGLCAWIARHGIPGRQIADWAVRTSAWIPVPGMSVSDGQGLTYDLLARYLEANRPADWCRAGGTVFCRELATRDLLRNRVRAIPAWADAAAAEGSISLAVEGTGIRSDVLSFGLLAALEEDFGSERFGAFWRSDASLENAFRSAFGTDPALWYRDRIQEQLGPRRAGPGPGLADLAVVAAALLAGLAGSTWVARRRTVA